MNKARRKQLDEAINQLQQAQAELTPALEASEHNTLEEDSPAVNAVERFLGNAKNIVETCRDEEQEFLDNMPEAMAESAKGEAAQCAIDAMEEAISKIDEINANGDEVGEMNDLLEGAIDSINEATA